MNTEAFSQVLASEGIACPDDLKADGKLHRYRANKDKHANSWYVLYDSKTFLTGFFGCWKLGKKGEWCSVDKSTLSRDDWNKQSGAVRDAQQQRLAQEQHDQDEARKKCHALFQDSPPAPKEHPYLKSKGISVHGQLCLSTTGSYPDWLVLPLHDEHGVIHSCQFIADDGTKKFAYHGRVKGCFFWLHKDVTMPIVVCEGYATGASIHEATGWTVACAMNCGNLLNVAKILRSVYPAAIIVIAGDNDLFTEGNPGATKARDAARNTKSSLALPQFPESYHNQKPTDFNDLHRLGGLEEVKIQIESSFAIIARSIGTFELPPQDDVNELLSKRFLSNHGGLLINGPTGMGKSSFLVQAAACWANSIPFFDITPTRALSTLIIQAENDDGDVAEMRNGICTGLNFTEYQRRQFFDKVSVHTSGGITGLKFCMEVVGPLLALHRPNIVGIDPALSFLGGDVKEQKDVGAFLRTYLNPLLKQYKCACIMLHHTNKPPSGKEKAAWRNGEFAYLGSGSAEWANWARAVLSLQDSGTHGVYRLHAGKRGARLGWKDDQDEYTYDKIIRHSKEKGVICWHDGEESDIGSLDTPDRKSDNSRADLLALLSPASPMEKDVLIARAQENGIGIQKANNLIKLLLSESRVFEWHYPRPKLRPKIAICKEPPPSEYQPKE